MKDVPTGRPSGRFAADRPLFFATPYYAHILGGSDKSLATDSIAASFCFIWSLKMVGNEQFPQETSLPEPPRAEARNYRDEQSDQRPSLFNLSIPFILMICMGIFSSYSMVRTFAAFNQTTQAFAQKIEYDRDFAAVMMGNLEEQQVKIDDVRARLEQLVTLAKQGAVSPDKLDPLMRELNQAFGAVTTVAQLRKDSATSIVNWSQTSHALEIRNSSLDLSLITSAHAKEWTKENSKKRDKADMPASLQPAQAEEAKPDKFERFEPFLIAFMIIPTIFGLCGFACQFSPTAEVQKFGRDTVTAIIGYLTGLGAGTFALAFA